MKGAPKLENIPTWVPVVALALVDEEGRWLMHRRPDHKHHGGLWEFPGGKVEADDSPRAALVREITEEIGIALDPDALEPVGFADLKGPDPIVILLYTARHWSGDPAALEGGAVGWFAPEDAAKLDLPPLDRALVTFMERMPGRTAPNLAD